MSEQSLLVSNKPPFRSLFFILLIIVVGFIVVGPTIGLVISSFFYDGDVLEELQQQSIKPDLLPAILIMQGVTTLIGLILFPLIYLRYIEHKSLRPFFPEQPKLFSMLALVAVAGMTFSVTISPLVEWNAGFKFPEFMSGFEKWARTEEDRLAEFTKAATAFNSLEQMLLGMLVIAIIPAIGEELVFRGMIQHELWRGTQNAHVAIWLSAFFFSAIHVQFYGFVPRLLLGALFGYLYYWSGNLLLPMFAHFINNGLGVILFYLSRKNIDTYNLESSDSAPLEFVAVSALITIGLLYYIRHFYKFSRSAGPADQSSDI